MELCQVGDAIHGLPCLCCEVVLIDAATDDDELRIERSRFCSPEKGRVGLQTSEAPVFNSTRNPLRTSG